MHRAAPWQPGGGGGSGVSNNLPLGEIMLTADETAAMSEGVPTNRAEWHTFLSLIFRWLEINFSSVYHQFYVSCSPTREWSSGSYGTMSVTRIIQNITKLLISKTPRFFFWISDQDTILSYELMCGMKESFAILRVVVRGRAQRLDLGYLK